MKALKPNSVIPPLLFGLGVKLDHMFGSKWLIHELYRLGYSISYSEVTRFKQSILTNEELVEPLPGGGRFIQWVADNVVDHNTITLDGKGTFHATGIISCSNYDECDLRYQHIRRNAKIMRVDELPKDKSIKVHWYQSPDIQALSKILLTPVKELCMPMVFSEQINLDVLWHFAGFAKKEKRPNWSGYMHLATAGMQSIGKSTITMLPIMDLNPSDESTIYSTLIFIKEQAC